MKTLSRSSNSINIATFWEYHQNEKFIYDAPYQRSGDVWAESESSFLIDTILKNFPIPPIFLHQKIDVETGKTLFDVIDGKQRLTSILKFIKGEIFVPEDFGDDSFGDPILNGISFSELSNDIFQDWRKLFWKYELSVEYIDAESIDVVSKVFDRLNRNGQPLTSQELRNARYHSTKFVEIVKELSSHRALMVPFQYSESKRLEHYEFTTELLLVILDGKPHPGDSPTLIDKLYEKYANWPREKFQGNVEQFQAVANSLGELELDFVRLRICGLSHIYALWLFSFVLVARSLPASRYRELVTNFYLQYLEKSQDENILKYRKTMSAGTKGSGRRKERVNALLAYCGISAWEDGI